MLQSFLECPYSFYSKYVLGEKDTATSSALEFGTALHMGIRNILDGDDGKAAFEMYWDSLKDKDMIYYRHGWQELRDLALNKFLHNFDKLHARKFTEFKQEETLEMPFLGSHTLQGTFDLAGKYDGTLSICDWKTSKSEYKRSKIDKNPQMWIYAKLYQHKYGVLPEQLCYKVFRKDTGSIQTLTTHVTPEKLVLHINNIEYIVKYMLLMIESKDFYHTFDCFCKGY